MLIIHPPQAKLCEPPAGLALLTAALQAHGHNCTVCDMNIEGFHYLCRTTVPASDTWSRRAFRHREKNLQAITAPETYISPARYRRAVADLNRVMEIAGINHGISLSLANYQNSELSPQKSGDLLRSAETFRHNIFFPYFAERITQLVTTAAPRYIGFSLNYLSQALCTFAMIGFIRHRFPELQIILGGGLITTWRQNPGWRNPFPGLVDHLIVGRGEQPLLSLLGTDFAQPTYMPDYTTLQPNEYLAPGFILPYAASSGCFWKKCSFCPETSEANPYIPNTPATVTSHIAALTLETRPTLLHFLDNAISPPILHSLTKTIPGVPWYGFIRFSRELTDPEFCRQLRKSGCVMLKLGLESGSQTVLDQMQKGIRLELVSTALKTLRQAGITTYVYLLFGTPAESLAEARETLQFVKTHGQEIGFLNLAIFNLPVCSPEAVSLSISEFYEGDLSIYRDFHHPRGWQRKAIRQFLDGEFKRDQTILKILHNDPPLFTSNHAPFFC